MPRQQPRRPVWSWCLLTGAAVFLQSAPARAQDYRDDLGYAALKAELGAAVPTGSGVSVSQIEAPGDVTGSYFPDTSYYEFNGKTITAKSGASAVSGHATTVAVYFYGTNSSMAPGITVIDSYEVNNWLGTGFLRAGLTSTSAPRTESRNVQNHSWIGTVDNGGPIDVDILRRFDYAIQTNDFVAVVGLNNGFGSPVPQLLASAYNAISVGLSNGGASSGLTTVDGSGRVKPEIVSDIGATSFSTPTVGAAAALLRQNAPTNGKKSVTLKALLLAGAAKTPFPGWNRTTTRPLDARYGAGLVNVFHSYHILTAGQQSASTTTSVNVRGWDYATTSASKLYFFDVAPGDDASRFSAILTWHRVIADGNPLPAWGAPTSSVANLALKLYHASGFVKGALVDESVSPVDNVEHLYQPNLPPGRYALEVVQDAANPGTTYALAWNSLTTVSVAATAPTATERDQVPGSFTFTRAGATTNALTIKFAMGGTATAGVDYATLPTSVTIPAGQASTTLPLTPLSDALAEGDETVMLTLTDDFAYAFNTGSATATIQDQPIDTWRFSHFTAAELNDPAISGDLADAEGDGVVNLLEYALDLDPKTPNASGLPVNGFNDGGRQTLTYTKVNSAVDLSYVVEISTELATWTTLTEPVVAPLMGESNPTETVTVIAPAPAASEQRQFLRLRVTRSAP